jgi:hypothetical protein
VILEAMKTQNAVQFTIKNSEKCKILNPTQNVLLLLLLLLLLLRAASVVVVVVVVIIVLLQHHLALSAFFSENIAGYDIMWKNIVQADRSQMTL